MSSFQHIARQSALFGIVALFGGLAGFLFAAANGITLDGHDHGTDHHTMPSQEVHKADSHSNAHDMPLILDADSLAPEIAITLHQDPVSGYNLHLMTQNFIFAGADAGRAHKAGEGHAHLYIDGVKQARLYGPWTHIATLDDSAKLLSVSLNSNDHKPLSYKGQLIEASLSLAEFR